VEPADRRVTAQFKNKYLWFYAFAEAQIWKDEPGNGGYLLQLDNGGEVEGLGALVREVLALTCAMFCLSVRTTLCH
jgi:hypothetical protein